MSAFENDDEREPERVPAATERRPVTPFAALDGTMQDFALTLNRFIDHAAKWHPSATVATATPDGDVLHASYADIRDRSYRLAGALRRRGVTPGARVATLAWNTQGHLEALYAIVGMGAVCHTLNPRLTSSQLADMVRQSGAEILFASADLLPLANDIVDRERAIRDIIVIDGEIGVQASTRRNSTLRDVLQEYVADPGWGEFDERSASGLCFTSGTTGAPKGVTYTHRSSFLHTLRMLQAEVMGFTRDDSVLAAVPMFHANAWGLPFAVPAVGAQLVLPGKQIDGASLARLIATERVTVGIGVPTVWLGLVSHIEETGIQLPSLKRVIVGGSALPQALMERIETQLGCIVQTSWGMTELSPSGTVAPPGDESRGADRSGRPAIGVDLLVADATGEPLVEQRNAEGHLYVRGAAVVERYFGHDDQAINSAGWFATGDLARIDDDGNLLITGRAKDLIKSGGEWVNPAEIEAIIGGLPEIDLVAVVGQDDPRWGERPVMIVKLTDGRTISDDDLRAALADRIPSWWLPDRIIRLDAIPLAPTGKIDKMRLRADYGAG
jgi:acyl-CoA synthetase (AMP-forming)/AMP-acid ligase II